MATYSITINERTQIGKSILQLMQSLTSVFTVCKINTAKAKTPNANTLEAIRQAKAGEVIRYNSAEELIQKMYEL